MIDFRAEIRAVQLLCKVGYNADLVKQISSFIISAEHFRFVA